MMTVVTALSCTKAASACDSPIPGMACIPAGDFIRGSNDYEEDEKPQEKVYVSQFYMDITEVTNKEFNKCTAQGKCQSCLKSKLCHKIGPSYGKDYLGPDQPAMGIPWYSAREYCEFVGKRLPTEAEWEKAARGPDGNIFPWGNEPATCERAIIETGEHDKGIKGCHAKRMLPHRLMHSRPVKSRAPGAYGLYDMAGNAHEWVQDWYTPSYAACGEKCRGRDPKGPCDGADNCPGYTNKLVRGGSWWWTAPYARGSKRRPNFPHMSPWENYHHFGFRCAKSP